MNHYAARQRKDDNRWDYTCANKRTGTHPVGYCAGYRELTEQDKLEPWWTPSAIAEYESRKDKYHKDGHEFADEACACYRQYLLDTCFRAYDPPKDPQTLHKCAVCGEFTAGWAEVGDHDNWYLCDKHRNREEVETLFRSVGDCWSSY